MQHRLGELFGEQLALRVGVNTGEVVVGRPREGSSFVTGDAVNVGARLEQAAAPGEILAGERTVTAVRGAFEFAERRTVDAKGKAGGVVCRRLVRALSLMRPRGIGTLRQAFVGREREVEQLRATYEQVVLDHEPRLVTIIGDAGVGKTRLVRELWAWLADQEPPPLQRTGRCLSYGRGIAYWPLAEVLREHFGILESDPADVAAARLGSRPFLGLTLGLPVGEDLHPLVGRERLHDAWVELLGDLVRERPSVLLIEDLHWAEDDLCDLIETLVRGVDGPLLVLTTARPELLERRPGWGGARYDASLLTLEALPPDEVAHLLDELLGAELPPALRSIVVERAEGNPFFVEELIATLIDRGVLERLNGGWSYARLPEGFHVPDTVQAVLAARIDLLPPAEKGALQAASVIGRVFWTGPVYDLVEGTAPDFTVLEERDFVRRRHGSSMTGEREYAIKHALTREVAYESLPKARRARLHAGFAEWLERSGRAEDEHAPLLAHHYAQAVRPEDIDLAWPRADEQIATLRRKALHWSRRAAELAIGRYEIDEGLSLLHQAVALQPEQQEQAKLWEEIGHANALKFDGESFREAIEQAIELGGASAERYTELALQTARRSGMWKRMPDRTLAESWLDRALELAQPGTPTYSRALAAAALWRKDETAALELHAITEDAGDPDLRVERSRRARRRRLERRGPRARASLCGGAPESPSRPLGSRRPAFRAHERGQHQSRDRPSLSGAGAQSAASGDGGGASPHHRVHGVAVRIDVEAWAGYWETVRELTPSVEQVVEANKATPCPANATSCSTARRRTSASRAMRCSVSRLRPTPTGSKASSRITRWATSGSRWPVTTAARFAVWSILWTRECSRRSAATRRRTWTPCSCLARTSGSKRRRPSSHGLGRTSSRSR